MTDEELIAGFLRYQESRSFSEHTIKRRREGLETFGRLLAPASLAAATTADVEELMLRLNSPRTRHAYRSDINQFYVWAIRRELLTSNPVDGTGSIKVPQSVPKPAPVEHIMAVFAVASGRVQLALMLGALAGLRISEIVSLEMGDVHLQAETPVIIVRGGKGGRDRIVPLHPTLQTLLANRPPGWLFPVRRRGGGHTTAEAMRHSFNYWIERAGVPRFTPHQLRHYFGTQAAQLSHGNLLLVGTLMGHASMNTTRGYTAWAPEEGAKVIAQMTGVERRDDLAARRNARAG